MIGIVYALLSAVLFGVSAPFAKMLLGAVSPSLLAGFLYLGSGLGLAVVRLVWRSKEAGLSRKDLPWLAAAVLSGGIVGPVRGWSCTMRSMPGANPASPRLITGPQKCERGAIRPIACSRPRCALCGRSALMPHRILGSLVEDPRTVIWSPNRREPGGASGQLHRQGPHRQQRQRSTSARARADLISPEDHHE